MQQPGSRVVGASGSPERTLLASGLAVLIGFLAFFGLGQFVATGRTLALDDWILLALRKPTNRAEPIGPAWVADVARDITALGSTDILWLATLGVAGYLGLDGRRRVMGFVFVAVGSGWGLSFLLKDLWQRVRPTVVPHLMPAHFSSFPSGHSMMAAVVYFTLGGLLARLVTKRWLRWYVLGIATTLSVLVGLSRLILGVHYPTDVVAGWVAGLTWATLCERIERRLVARGAIEATV